MSITSCNLWITFEGFKINGLLRAQNDRLDEAVLLRLCRVIYLKSCKSYRNVDLLFSNFLIKFFVRAVKDRVITFERFKIADQIKAQNDRLTKAVILSPHRNIYLESLKS